MTKQSNIIIIGGSHSGISAGINLKKRLGDKATVTIIERGNTDGFSFVGANGLLHIAGILRDDEMGYATPAKIEKSGIELRLETEVIDIDFDTRSVTLGSLETLHYDYLILATGSSPVIPPFAAADIEAKRAQNIKTIDDIVNLKRLIADENVQNITIIGGGYIGVETAETLAKVGQKCDLIQGAGYLCNTYYDPEFAKYIADVLENNGVSIQYNKRVETLDYTSTDAYVLSLGFRPNSELGGNKVTREFGAYSVDKQQRVLSAELTWISGAPVSDGTGGNEDSNDNADNAATDGKLDYFPSVYAIGDCSTTFNNATDSTAYMAIGSATAREASIVADAIASEIEGVPAREFNFGVQGANALSIFGFDLASVGLTEAGAKSLGKKTGIEYKSVTYFGPQIADELQPDFLCVFARENESDEYMLPDFKGGKVLIKFIYEAKTYRIVGAQIASYEPVAELMHQLSLVVEQKLTVFELKNLDVFFLPQINQLYNVVRRALNHVK